jgi:hypothetical protein
LVPGFTLLDETRSTFVIRITETLRIVAGFGSKDRRFYRRDSIDLGVEADSEVVIVEVPECSPK